MIIPVLIDRIIIELKAISDTFSILLIDDGSIDDSWSAIKNERKKYIEVQGYKLQSNVGQHNAIRAGIDLVNADWIFVMDCDLQDNPSELKHLYDAANSGVHIVLADRRIKKVKLYYKMSSWLLNNILSIFLGKHINYRTGNFGIYSNDAIKCFKQLPYKNFYLPVAARACKLPLKEIAVLHQPRFSGESTYTFKKQFLLAISAMRFALSAKESKVDCPVYVIAETTL